MFSTVEPWQRSASRTTQNSNHKKHPKQGQTSEPLFFLLLFLWNHSENQLKSRQHNLLSFESVTITFLQRYACETNHLTFHLALKQTLSTFFFSHFSKSTLLLLQLQNCSNYASGRDNSTGRWVVGGAATLTLIAEPIRSVRIVSTTVFLWSENHAKQQMIKLFNAEPAGFVKKKMVKAK